MKVQIVENTPVFKPVTIQITFDTAKELKAFVDMVGYNESIPELLTQHCKPDVKASEYVLYQDILTLLHRVSVGALCKS